jgi:CheY-like chemotaxis protein
MPKQNISRIFVVDDEKIIAETVALILRMNGYSARFFLNLLEALQMLISEASDLLIADVKMPQLYGIDLAIRMRKCLQPTPVIGRFNPGVAGGRPS